MDKMTWTLEFPVMNVVNMTLKKKVTPLKNVIGTSQMNLNDPKFYFKNSLDTQRKVWRPSFGTCFS